LKDTQLAFCYDRSTTEQILTIQKSYEKPWEYTNTVA